MDLLELIQWQKQKFGTDRPSNTGSFASDWWNKTISQKSNFAGLNKYYQKLEAEKNFPINMNAKNNPSFDVNEGGNFKNFLTNFDKKMPAFSTPSSNGLTQGLNTGYDTIANTISAVPGWGTIVGGAMKVAGLASDALNTVTNGATTIENATLASDKIMSSKFLSLTPIGLANALTKKKIEGYDTGLANSISRGYNATIGPGKTEMGGISRFGAKIFTGKDLAKDRTNKVNKVNAENAVKSNIGYLSNKNAISSNNTVSDIYTKNYQQLTGGQRTNILSAKKGTKLSTLKTIKERVKGKIVKKEPEGKNVIPSGALHARKNNLPEEIASEVTHKGIPVITKDDEGKIKQHAEIENSEIIFTKNVTLQLEELLKKFKDGDENAAIEAGKLLTYEILENTEDNVNLINTIE